MTFQKTTIKVAIVVYIICTVALVIMLYQGTTSVLWPPETGTCPDLWITAPSEDSTDANGQIKAEGTIDIKIEPANQEGFSNPFASSSTAYKCKPNTTLTKEKGNWGSWPCTKSGDTWTCPSMNFDQRPYNSTSTKTAIAAKCNWANKYDVFWSGITDIGSACNVEPVTNDCSGCNN